MKHYRQSHSKGEKKNIRATTLSSCGCFPAPVSQLSARWSRTQVRTVAAVAYEWQWVTAYSRTSYFCLLIQHVLYVSYVSIHLLPSTQPLFLLPLRQRHAFLWAEEEAVASLSQTVLCFHIHTCTCLASLCVWAITAQAAWVERPLGSGRRYCRAMRWSILDHCISTEQ